MSPNRKLYHDQTCMCLRDFSISWHHGGPLSEAPRTSQHYVVEGFQGALDWGLRMFRLLFLFIQYYLYLLLLMLSIKIHRDTFFIACNIPAVWMHQNQFGIHFNFNGMWSQWQFSFWLLTRRTYVWFKIERKTLTVIIQFIKFKIKHISIFVSWLSRTWEENNKTISRTSEAWVMINVGIQNKVYEWRLMVLFYHWNELTDTSAPHGYVQIYFGWLAQNSE